MVTDTLFGDMLYGLKKSLNIDYLYFEPDIQQKDLRINVGEFITKDLFLSYSRMVINEPDESWNLDYYLTPSLIFGSNFSIKEGTAWRLMYQIQF